MRAVLDANVYVGALLGAGLCADVVKRSGVLYTAVVCPALLDEIRKTVYGTSKAAAKIASRIPDADKNAFMFEISQSAEEHPDPSVPTEFTRDPSDDYLIALARGASCDCIVSQDKDLLEWPGQVPPVNTPYDFAAACGILRS